MKPHPYGNMFGPDFDTLLKDPEDMVLPTGLRNPRVGWSLSNDLLDCCCRAGGGLLGFVLGFCYFKVPGVTVSSWAVLKIS